MTKTKYTSGQRKAYQSGMGYSVAHSGNRINFKSALNRQSFIDGFNAGLKAQNKSPDRYPKSSKFKVTKTGTKKKK